MAHYGGPQAGVVVAVLGIELGDLLGIPGAEQDANGGGCCSAALLRSRKRRDEYRVFQLRQDNALRDRFGHRIAPEEVWPDYTVSLQTMSITLIGQLSKLTQLRTRLALY